MSDSKRFPFGKDRINDLPIPEAGKRITYHDTKIAALQLRVSSSGVKTFSVFRRVKGGQPERVTLGKFPSMTVEQARRLAAKVNSEIEEGSNPAAVKRVIKIEPTLEEFFEKEYGPRHGKKLTTWRNYQSQFDTYIRPSLGKLKLTSVSRDQVARVVSDVEKSGKSGSMVNRVRNLISGIYRQAIEWGAAENNPATGVRGRKEKKRDRFLQSTELPRFFASLAEEENDTIRDFFLLSLLTGARRGNLLEMRWEQIRLNDGIWYIPKTKNDDPQNVTLCPEAVEILKARKNDDSPWVFPSTGKSGHLAEPKTGWRRILDRDELIQLQTRIREAGTEFQWPIELGKSIGHKGRTRERLEDALLRARVLADKLEIDPTGTRMSDLRIHDLRRTLGSWQAKTGASLVIIGKSLNQKSQAATAIYARLDLDPVRQSVNTATSAMLEAGGLKTTGEVLPIKNNRTKA